MHDMPKNSFYTQRLARGCQLCQEGAKLVLLITGRCNANCFYCPLSEKKRGHQVIYANERLIKNDAEIIDEAELIEAKGAGITGGDPLLVTDITVNAIRICKEYFGNDFHIHLYTAAMEQKPVKLVEDAGLDEIRFHPHARYWPIIEMTEFKNLINHVTITKGVEIPLIPHMRLELMHLLQEIDSYQLDFINLNELEFSETNMDALDSFGYVAKNDESAAAQGSEQLAYEIADLNLATPLHYCSASFKDAVQLRKRIERRARNVVQVHELITEDGTLLKGVIHAPCRTLETLRKQFGIAPLMMVWNEERRRIETSPFILEEIASKIPYDSYLVEEYPTADRLEVERTPLHRT